MPTKKPAKKTAKTKPQDKEYHVRMYSTQVCPYCILVENFLKKQGIKYEKIDVGADEAAANEMIEKSGQTGVPVVEIDGEIIVGFDEKRMKKALKIK